MDRRDAYRFHKGVSRHRRFSNAACCDTAALMAGACTQSARASSASVATANLGCPSALRPTLIGIKVHSFWHHDRGSAALWALAIGRIAEAYWQPARASSALVDGGNFDARRRKLTSRLRPIGTKFIAMKGKFCSLQRRRAADARARICAGAPTSRAIAGRSRSDTSFAVGARRHFAASVAVPARAWRAIRAQYTRAHPPRS